MSTSKRKLQLKYKKNYYVLPTEAELSEDKRAGYYKSASYQDEISKRIGLIDAQDGVIHHWSSTKIKLNPSLLKAVSKFIEKWMDSPANEGRTEISIKTIDGGKYGVGFQKYIVNFQSCANCCEQWMIVKCCLNGWPKIYSRHLGNFGLNSVTDLHFVHNQIFSIQPYYMEGHKKETTFVNTLNAKVKN